jgi:hypothetical protein
MWFPFLFNCPVKVEKFFRLLNLVNSEYDKENLNSNHCIILSTWHPDQNFSWLDYLKTIRMQGFLNPVIILSVETKSCIYSQINFISEGVHFLRLPFTKSEYKLLIASLMMPDNTALKQAQYQLDLEYVYLNWKKLRHGHQLEILNSVFYPLRAALLLDTNAIEKKKIVAEIVNGPVTKYWQIPEIISLRKSSESFRESNDLIKKVHGFFSNLDILIEKITSDDLFEDEALVNTIDNLIFSFREIDKLII